MATDAPLRAPEEQLILLAHHLRAERGGLLIVASPDDEAEQVLVEEVRLRVQSEVAVEQVTLAAEPVERLSLSHHLATLPQPRGKAVVFIFGLGALSPEARVTAINAMNWGRERLRWSGYTVVLWVRPGTPGELGNRAPDFFSWRSDVFTFDVPSDPAARQQMLARLRLFAPATLEEMRRRYLDYVRRTYQWLDFRGLLQLRNVVRLPLDEVFVPLEATSATDVSALSFVGRLGSLGFSEQRAEHRVPVIQALQQHQRLVVLGDPGAGKSTLLRFLALTFAQGKQDERFHLQDERLPILLPLAAFAEARKAQPDLMLPAFLPRYFLDRGLPDFSALFTEALQKGRALVLLDGLDEMLTFEERVAATQAVAMCSETYPDVRIIVSSRIAGYLPNLLPASFAPFTLAPFDKQAIAQFAKQWSLAFESIGLPDRATVPPDLHQRAERHAQSLITAATSHPGVQSLATNPLMLTLLALIHHQGTRLPNRRTELYRLCIEALAETWNLARNLDGQPIILSLGERRIDEEFVVHLLGPVAYWMHEHKPNGVISYQELELRLSAQFQEDGASTEEATAQVRAFVALAREQIGLLVERAPDEFRFLHLSFQEYLAARFLSERRYAFTRLKPHLHDFRWREVIRLTAGCLRGDYATEFIEQILNAHGPFTTLFQRVEALASDQPVSSHEIKATLRSVGDFLLAFQCSSDEVAMSNALNRNLTATLFDLAQSRLVKEAGAAISSIPHKFAASPFGLGRSVRSALTTSLFSKFVEILDENDAFTLAALSVFRETWRAMQKKANSPASPPSQ